MLEPESAVLDVKTEVADAPQSDTISSSCTCKNDESLGCDLKTEDLPADYFESNPGYYEEARVAEFKDALSAKIPGVTPVKNEPEDCKPFRCDFCQDSIAGSSISDELTLPTKMSVVNYELSGNAANS